MNALQILQSHGLQPADVIVVGRGPGFVDHYLVYMGHYREGHYFMANMEQGVRWLHMNDVHARAHEFHFKRVRRFQGQHHERQAAVRRAESRHGQAYSLVSFNCEHFANYVQDGEASSYQVQKVGVGLAAAALLLLGFFAGGSDER